MGDDADLLRRYTEAGSEAAFTELVGRHLPLVYFTALRRTGGDAALAQEVAQSVFSLTARKATALAQHATLTGWLYTTARHVADRAARNEQTRRRYEQSAARHALTTMETPTDWEKVRPVIDEALDALSGTEREIILIRYFEGRPFADIGAALRISEEAARMRVGRALEKLRVRLERNGIPSASAALALALSTQAGLAAPAGMVASISGTALAAATGTTGAAVFAGFMSATKLTAAAAVAALLATGFGLVERERADRAEAALHATTEAQSALAARLARTEAEMSRAARRAAEADQDSGRLLAAIEAAQTRPPAPAKNAAEPTPSPSVAPGDRLSRRLTAMFPSGIVATVGDRSVTVEDVRQRIAPVLAELEAETPDPDDFGQRLNGLQNSIVKDSVERLLLLKEFSVATDDEPQRSIPADYVDNVFADTLSEKFSGDRAKLTAHLQSRGITEAQYRKELQEEIAFRYMHSRQRKLNQNPPRPAAK